MPKEKLIFSDNAENSREGTWFLGRLLVWNWNFRKSIIRLSRVKSKIDRLRGIIAWIIIFAGWLALGLWIYMNFSGIQKNPINLLFFWRKYNFLILAFLLSLWFDLFVVYRNSEKKARLKKINYKLFEIDKQNFKEDKVKKYNVAKAFSDITFKAIEDAYLLAVKLRHDSVEILHLFRVLLQNKEVQGLLIRLDVDAQKMVDMLDRRLVKPQGQEFKGRSNLSPSFQEVLISAFTDAYNLNQKSVDVLNLLVFCYEKDKFLAEILYDLELDEDKIINAIAWFRVNKLLLERYNNFRRLAILKPGKSMDRAYTAIATPTLDHFSHDLTLRAKAGALDICVGRSKEINSIFEAFSGGHNGVLLVGQIGIGKTTIINGLAQLMVEERVPKFLTDKRLVELDVSGLVSGANPAQAQEKLLQALNEVARARNIILYIDNIENLIGISAGSKESLDLSEVLGEALSRHHLYCIASATTENYSHYIENKAIGDIMTTIGIKEPDINQTIQILESKVGLLESKYSIYIVYSALEAAVKMASRYLHEKFLPLKAINLLESAALITARNSKNNPAKCFCSKEDVALAIAEITGIPTQKVSIDEREKLLNLESEIHKRLIGQVEAVEAVSASLRRARAEMKESKRPIASFLFLGPTGVGKTELAKAVSESYFGDEDYLVRLDMSEYQQADSVSKMIGDAQGAIGYLTEAVRKKPFSLVLLDEIEKAYPDILNLFLQLFDDGRLTDGQGRTISFTESIIIATSNIGALYIQEQIKAKTQLNIIKQELIDNQLNKYMRPELINRFDGIIVFKPLDEENIFSITTLMLKKIKKNLAEKGIDFKADKDGVMILAREGYDPKFGARPLRRLLQDKIENEIANRILSGELKRRDIVIINNKAKIEIQKAEKL